MQVGFRVLGEEEADVSRQMLISLCDMFAEEVPTLAAPRDAEGRPQVRAGGGALGQMRGARPDLGELSVLGRLGVSAPVCQGNARACFKGNARAERGVSAEVRPGAARAGHRCGFGAAGHLWPVGPDLHPSCAPGRSLPHQAKPLRGACRIKP